MVKLIQKALQSLKELENENLKPRVMPDDTYKMIKVLVKIWYLPAKLVKKLDEKAFKSRSMIGIKDQWDENRSFVVFLIVFFSLMLYRLFTLLRLVRPRPLVTCYSDYTPLGSPRKLIGAEFLRTHCS